MENKCQICGKTPFKTINICAVHYHFCELCYKKLYYHFVEQVITKIKHP